MKPYVYSIICTVVILFLTLLLIVAQRGKARADPLTGTLHFRHSFLFRGFAYFAAFVIPLAITVLMFFKPPTGEGEVLAVIGLYALFAALSAPLLWESVRFRLVVSADGLECRSPWRGQRFIPWSEVKSVSYSTMGSWFVIRADDGWKFRVPILVPGLSQFLERCESHLPREALANAKGGYQHVGRAFPDEGERASR